MQPFQNMPPKAIKNIKYILCDIDDTLTTHGKMGAKAYTTLWQLSKVGIQIIPVTGRPAGWCDLMIRQWPIQAIVGENGAFSFYFEEGQLRTLTHPCVPKESVEQKLADLREACLEKFPGCRVAKDQFCRKYDLAIDFNEDPPYLGFETGQAIQEFCTQRGAVAKLSSIHVNAWYGAYDKMGMSLLYLQQVEKISPEEAKEVMLYFGDSPNDEPMFTYFPHSCGVANIEPFLNLIKNKPPMLPNKKGEKVLPKGRTGYCKTDKHLPKKAGA